MISYELVPRAIRDELKFLSDLISSGGPSADQYDVLDWTFAKLRTYRNTCSNLYFQLRSDSGGVFDSTETMQGHVHRKPHGYHGDYEIIDRIYRTATTRDPALVAWDHYFHSGTAAVAVRNRKSFFLELLCRPGCRPKSILNVASGPCRDLLEAFDMGYLTSCHTIACVEADVKAIDYAKSMLGEYTKLTEFRNQNALRYRDTRMYELVWCAGLFDYLSDSVAILLLRRLVGMAGPNGRVVVGNLSRRNSQRFYMEFGEWDLVYRDEGDLLRLAAAATGSKVRAHVEAEPTGVNLFLFLDT